MQFQNEFHRYAGIMLGQLLPFRKKNVLFGPQVCELAAVKPMWKAGFFVGCCLALENSTAAGLILSTSALPQEWQDAHSEIVADLTARNDNFASESQTYETAFPEAVGPCPGDDRTLATPEECAQSIGQRVWLGLAWGLLFAETATSMVEAWISQTGDWANLGVRGLQVQDKPLFSSVEEGRARAGSMYQEWLST